MKKKYLVTGGSGFIGAALVRRLLQEGHKIRVLDNNSRGNLRRLKDVISDIDFIEGDICDADTVKKATQGQDAVCHLAYVNGTKFFYTKPETVLEVGVKGMVNVLDACIQHNIPELILASSSEVYQTPPIVPTDESAPLIIPDLMNPRFCYGAGKIISEVMAINYGRRFFERVLIFRPHNVYGSDMGWEHVIPDFCVGIMKLTAANMDLKIQGTGQEKRAFIYIDDFIDALHCMLNKGQHLNVYHIGTQNEIAMVDLALLVAKTLGKEINIVPGQLKQGSTLRRCPDISKIQSLGFIPKRSLSDGIAVTADWYSENLNLMPLKE